MGICRVIASFGIILVLVGSVTLAAGDPLEGLQRPLSERELSSLLKDASQSPESLVALLLLHAPLSSELTQQALARPGFSEWQLRQIVLAGGWGQSVASRAAVDAEAIDQPAIGLPECEDPREIFADLSAEDKAAVWEEHLSEAIVREDLTFEQRLVLLQILERVKPEIYKDEASLEELTAFVDGWRESALEVFPLEELTSIVADLGDRLAPLGETGRPCRPRRRPCTCSTASDWCSGRCRSTIPNCEIKTLGCGTLWGYHCRGRCT